MTGETTRRIHAYGSVRPIAQAQEGSPMRPSSSRPSITLLAASGILAIVAAACSSSTGGSAAPSAAGSAAPSAASSAGAGEVYEVKAANGTVGAFITGEDGKTLYVFTADSANTSTCTGDCATNWPPFTVDAGETVKAGDGVTGALTTFARADGSMQVAINGMPLYYFKNDAKAGDTNGEGLNGKWFVASPTGAAPAPSSSGGGKYSY
jgi:predicted lipoprotein with Yx(FWY)xxD motif